MYALSRVIESAPSSRTDKVIGDSDKERTVARIVLTFTNDNISRFSSILTPPSVDPVLMDAQFEMGFALGSLA